MQASARRRTASTLESLIVLAVILFVCVAFAPKVIHLFEFTRNTIATRTANELQTALQRYAIDHGDFPQIHTYDDLVRLLGAYVTLPSDPTRNNWQFVSYYSRAGDYTLTLSVGGGDNPVTMVIRPAAISRS